MGNLQWQKDRLVEWLAGLWLGCVPVERTRQWTARMKMELSESQFQQTLCVLDNLTDAQFGPWLLDEAEPWQQALCLDALLRILGSIESALPGSPVIGAVALHVRDRDSLRSVLRLALSSYLPNP